MPNAADVAWFKAQFANRIGSAVAGTPLSIDLVTAIACQETGAMWSVLRGKGLTVDRILALCVGDTLDADRGRRAFPATKAELLAAPRGAEMFAVAHQALVDMAQFIPGYGKVAKNPNKFCHGFGLFQRDLQFFRVDPDYFLQRRYARFDDTLAHCVEELGRAVRKLGLQDHEALTDTEAAMVGIVYNTGGYRPSRGLKQGFFDGTRHYGEAILDYIRLSKTVAAPASAAELPAPLPGQAIVAPPSPVTAQGPLFRVDTREGNLNVRSEPRKSDPPAANVIGELPDGQVVRAVTGRPARGWMEIETSVFGAFKSGFVSAQYLVPEPEATEVPVLVPRTTPPTSGIVAVTMPRKPGRIARRTEEANAHSLNEPGQPARQGSGAVALRGELRRIVEWLAVDKPNHRRYQPRSGATFCNIYAHDYCHLAGVYLPRVWWTPGALVALASGGTVEPLIDNTIAEQRANDLFRWLRDFGPLFGWRQTGTLTKLQQEVNQGAVGLIVARRKEDGRSGHIVPVIPETDSDRARRSADGEVTAPLQSQAGTRNFRCGTGTANWWRGAQFAESAFWLHA